MSKNNKQLDEKAITEFKQQKRDIGYLISANNLKEAYKRLKAIEKKYNKYSPLYVLWGDYFKAKKEYKRAEKYYIQAIDLDNTEKTAHIQLIVLYDRNTEQVMIRSKRFYWRVCITAQ